MLDDLDGSPLGDPRSADVTLADATAALEAGQVDHAASIYGILAARGGADGLSAIFGLAVCHARRREWADAEARLLEVLHRAPSLGVARAYLGAVRLDLGRLEQAQADLDAALELAPGNAAVRIKRAELLLRLGRLPQAYTELQRAARLTAPDAATRDYLRALLLTTRKEMSRSIDRTGASPAEFWRALVARIKGPEAHPTTTPPAVTRTEHTLA